MTRTLSPGWWLAAAVAAVLALTAFVATNMPAQAASTNFGGTQDQTNFTALLSNTGNASTADDFSGISFDVASGTTVSSLGTLSARYNVVDTDCGGGSPRYQINVANGSTTGNINVYLGPEPNYTGCSQNTWSTTGNLLDGSRKVDTSQLPGGTFYDTTAHMLSTYGTWQVTGVQLVVDGGWAVSGNTQRVRITDANVGGTAFTYPPTGTGTTTVTLTAPTLTSPASGSTLTSAQWTSADWSDVTGSSTPITYLYESSNSNTTNSDGSFTTPLFQSGALTTSDINTSNTGEGTYYWHARAVDNNGVMSPWSSTFSVIVNNSSTSTGTTTPPGGGNAQDLINQLMTLQQQFPQYYWNLQWVINDLGNQGGGTTTPPTTGSAMIDNPNRTVMGGGAVDFAGRNFGHEEQVTITRNGTQVGTAHADGGGNFSTGSMTVPGASGTYTYVFTGQTSGLSATATVTVP